MTKLIVETMHIKVRLTVCDCVVVVVFCIQGDWLIR